MVLFLFYSIVIVLFLRLILIFLLLVLVRNTVAFLPSVPLPTSWHTRPCLQIGVLEIGKKMQEIWKHDLCVYLGALRRSAAGFPIVTQLFPSWAGTVNLVRNMRTP